MGYLHIWPSGVTGLIYERFNVRERVCLNSVEISFSCFKVLSWETLNNRWPFIKFVAFLDKYHCFYSDAGDFTLCIKEPLCGLIVLFRVSLKTWVLTWSCCWCSSMTFTRQKCLACRKTLAFRFWMDVFDGVVEVYKISSMLPLLAACLFQ